MSDKSKSFRAENETIITSDVSFLRSAPERKNLASTIDTGLSKPSGTSSAVNSCSLSGALQESHYIITSNNKMNVRKSISPSILVWSMFWGKCLKQDQEVSRDRRFSISSNIADHIGLEKSTLVGTPVKVEPDTISQGNCPIQGILSEANCFTRNTNKIEEKKLNFMESLSLTSTFQHKYAHHTTTSEGTKLTSPEKANSSLPDNASSITTTPSFNSTNSLPKKRRYSSQSNPSDGKISTKTENMVVSVLNATSNNLLSKQTLKSSLEWSHSPPDNSTSETDQPSCLLNFNGCDQRRSSPVQNDEENSCYGSEMGGPQENSRSSTSEELGANLFPITGFGNASNCAEYLNSDEKDSLQSSPPYFHDDDMYQTTTRGCNNNNKPKVHKCRSCGFTTTNKHESWEHIAQHMKPEKILRCTKCPFVTEYKHHLDFHMWNHEGKKPFKCDKCAYECVNKSMLKSHSKSHSSVYPFQCESCGYKTKYCHSMKIHLRRHKHHQPKAVLDDEGNPDPALFIDIHSNRRGPKQKKQKSGDAHQRQQQKMQQQLQRQQEQLAQPLHLQNPPPPPFTHPPPLATLALSQFNNYNVWPEKVFPSETAPIAYPMLAQPLESDNEEIFLPDACIEEKATPTLTAPFYLSPYDPLPLTIPPPATSRLIEPPNQNQLEEAPLNLCPQVAEAPLNLSLSHNSSHTAESNPGSSGSSSSSASSSTPAVKNRRKGVACKLKRISYPEMGATEDGPAPVAQSTSSSASTGGDVASLDHSLENAVTESHSEAENEAAELRNKSTSYYCEYCEITFHNQIMFTLHKGCHGFSDPFTCNRCGAKTDNKIDFYAHMISVAHL